MLYSAVKMKAYILPNLIFSHLTILFLLIKNYKIRYIIYYIHLVDYLAILSDLCHIIHIFVSVYHYSSFTQIAILLNHSYFLKPWFIVIKPIKLRLRPQINKKDRGVNKSNGNKRTIKKTFLNLHNKDVLTSNICFYRCCNSLKA